MSQEITTPVVRNSNPEYQTLKKWGLRWAILAAWRDQLENEGVRLPSDIRSNLEASRVKIASGCFSSCEIGCDLAGIERILLAVNSSLPAVDTDFWLELLGKAMMDESGVEKILRYSAVEARFVECGYRPCHCAN